MAGTILTLDFQVKICIDMYTCTVEQNRFFCYSYRDLYCVCCLLSDTDRNFEKNVNYSCVKISYVILCNDLARARTVHPHVKIKQKETLKR